jgi:hypothetical protein
MQPGKERGAMRRDVVFIDVDTQKCFIDEDGTLPVPEAG